MKEWDHTLNPHKILNKIENNEISRESGIQLFISLFEKTNKLKSRIDLLNVFGKIVIKNGDNFNFLEHILISDEDAIIRNISASLLLKYFDLRSIKTINWVLENETSPLVLNTIIKAIDHNKILYEKLHPKVELWFENFSNKLDLDSNNGKFIFNLELILAINDKNVKLNDSMYKFYSTLQNIGNNSSWLSIEDGKIVELKFNLFKWLFLRNYSGKISSLNKYRDLDLLLSLMKQMNFEEKLIFNIPSSIGRLNSLKTLDLSENSLLSLPQSMKNLSSLIKLDLSYNSLNEVPSFIKLYPKLEELDISYNKIKKLPSYLKNLPSLNLLRISGNDIREIPNELKNKVIY